MQPGTRNPEPATRNPELWRAVFVAGLCFLCAAALQSQPASPAGGNTHPVYKALRGLTVGSEAYQVSDFALEKDAARFTLTGTLHLLPAVQGKITGAVFIGQGRMAYMPPIAAERAMLVNLTRDLEFNETFDRAVFRFTDDTAETIKAAGTPTTSGPGAQAQDALKDTNQALRLQLKNNLHARILHDVLSPKAGGLFHAYIPGKKYSGRLIYMIDPQGAGVVAPEEIQLVSWADNKEGIFAAHHYSSFYKSGQRVPTTPGGWIDVEHQEIRVEIDPGGELSGNAAATFLAQVDGLAAVPLSLFPTLRVSGVTAGDGTPLAFIQEDDRKH